MVNQIKVENFGPIRLADVALGDLTLLVGAQASGKSLFLELLKLIVDRNSIIENLKKYSYIIGKDTSSLLDLYFGQGVSAAWHEGSCVTVDNHSPIRSIKTKTTGQPTEERIFYIPAQRILSIADGRPKAFSEFDPTTPYVLRQFSETLRVFMNGGLGGSTTLFPIKTRLKSCQRKSFNSSIFHDGVVELVNQAGQRKMRLKVDGMDMPFMTWSAGQKEFMPLLMGFYCVSGPPNRVIKKEQYEYVVIEEPEMGLHPQAIKAVLLQVLELVQSGYKVILSTHSTVPLEFVWAFNNLKESRHSSREADLMRLFDRTADSGNMLQGIFDKSVRTYLFARRNGAVESVDISPLDAGSENTEISEWGGLSEFASEAAELVSRHCYEE